MGLKLTGPLLCGGCGKPRGLGTHVCPNGRRKRRRTALRNPVTWECKSCQQPRGLSHSCGNRGDFRKRKREAATAERRRKRKAATARRVARRKEIAAARRERDRARKQAAKNKPKTSRPRGDSHEPGACGNPECPKYGCKAYWQGMADCLRPHKGF